MRRLGVFGGAFDPPHLAHVALVQAALSHLELDRMHVSPTGRPAHRAAPPTMAHHRLQMAQLAFAEIDRVEVDDAEICRPGPSFTVDTLLQLQRSYPGTGLFLVIGSDQAEQFEHWHRWQEVLRLARLCVVKRASDAEASQEAQNAVIQSVDGRDTSRCVGLGSCITLPMPPMNQSSTDIRQRIRTGRDWSALVPAAVARYIEAHQLYRSTR